MRSARRRKTVQAREVGGVLRVSIPASMTEADEERWVAEMLRRVERRSAAATIDLQARAAELAKRHRLPAPAVIRWVDNQEWRWGSCTPATRSIRISSRLAREPGWVLDYVVVHELAHLRAPRHDPAFWALVDRYPLAERARGFLIARGREPAPAGAEDAGADVAADVERDAGDPDVGRQEPSRSPRRHLTDRDDGAVPGRSPRSGRAVRNVRARRPV